MDARRIRGRDQSIRSGSRDPEPARGRERLRAGRQRELRSRGLHDEKLRSSLPRLPPRGGRRRHGGRIRPREWQAGSLHGTPGARGHEHANRAYGGREEPDPSAPAGRGYGDHGALPEPGRRSGRRRTLGRSGRRAHTSRAHSRRGCGTGGAAGRDRAASHSSLPPHRSAGTDLRGYRATCFRRRAHPGPAPFR